MAKALDVVSEVILIETGTKIPLKADVAALADSLRLRLAFTVSYFRQ